MSAGAPPLLHRLGVLVLLWCTGLYLRLTMLAAPPLAPRISADMGLGQAASGALTTLPVLMLAVGALLGSFAISRIGVRHAVVAGLAVAATASAARGLAPPVIILYAATAAMGLGIAVMQPALATLAGTWCPGFVALAVGVYMNGMYAGEFLGAGVTLPVVLPLAGGDWRLALVLWSLPALPLLAALYLPRHSGSAASRAAGSSWPDWRNGGMWRLGLLQGATSVLFLGTNAYMADILQTRGEADALSRTLLWFNLSQGVASIAMLLVGQRLVLRRAPLAITSVVTVVAGTCFLFLGGLPGIVAAFVLGMGSAMQLILVVMAAPYLAPPGQTGRVSAGIFAIGYGIAFGVPLAGGLFAEQLGRPWTAMLPMLAYAAATVPLALTLRLRDAYG